MVEDEGQVQEPGDEMKQPGERRFLTVNGKVACTPFEKRSVESEVRQGFAMVKQKKTLTRLEVVFAYEDKVSGNWYSPGNGVWLKAEMCVHQWAKEVFTYDGKSFILVPAELVQVVDR